MVLLAGFFALLSRYTGQRDLLVGTPVANGRGWRRNRWWACLRTHWWCEARLDDGPSFGELLKRVREAVMGRAAASGGAV
jgi:hypothetical protein